MLSATMTRLSILHFLSLVAILLTPQYTAAQNVGAVDTTLCFSSLMAADTNNDRQLNRTEYVTFLKIYGLPGIEAETYQDLPLVLRSTFTFLSCSCGLNGGGASCCIGPDAYIPTDGAADFEIPTPDQATYLYNLCKVTDDAVDQATPTAAPVMTPEPTQSPTMASASPSISGQPSISPTLLFSTEPSSAAPTFSPTTQKPTLSESPSLNSGVDAVVRTTYLVVIANGKSDDIPQTAYKSDLIQAMDMVATDVAVQIEERGGGGGRERNRRKLAVTVELPTSIVLISEQEWKNDGSVIEGKYLDASFLADTSMFSFLLTKSFFSSGCSAELGNPGTDACQEVTAAIRLFLDDEDVSDVSNSFKSTLDEEIEKGSLAEALILVNPDSPVAILSSNGGEQNAPTVSPAREIESDDGLSTGATVGIAAAGVLLFAIIIVSVTKAKGDDDDAPRKRQDDGKFVEATPSEELKMAQKEVGSGLEWQTPKPADEEQPSSLGENPWVKSGKQPKKSDDGSVISDENSAGWSDAYSSSMGTNDSDENAEDLLVAAGMEGSDNGEDKVGIANMGELEAAISAGDWAAVGASAAVLAASQYETDSQSNSKSSMSYSAMGSSMQSSLEQRELDSAKALELDNLIQTGDWEGVIQAAARFEAGASQDGQAATVFEDNDSRSGSRSDSRSGSYTSSSIFSSSIQPSSAASGTQEPPPNQDEYRKEVQELVSKVVPEELEHVDDMIAQFKGRENELLETLRTMQERNISQKAKKADQQKAKMEAKKMVAKAKKEAKSQPKGEEPETYTKQEENQDDAAAAAAADWAIAQALSNLEKGDSSYDDQSNVVPDEDFDDEGSL